MSELGGKLKEFLTAYKKTLKILLAIAVLLVILCGVLQRMYVVEGVVSNVSGNKITVSDFLGSRTVTVEPYWLNNSPVSKGERIEVVKNLQGQIIEVEKHDFQDRDKARVYERDNMGNFERARGH